MTPQQLQTLKADILADPALAALAAQNAYGQIRLAYNELTAYIVWRTQVSQDEIMLNGFDWARVDNLSVGKGRVWEWMFDNSQKSINPSKSNVRAGIDQVWVGTAADLAVRAAVYVHCKRAATRAEKLLASGVGTDVSPSVMTFEGQVTDADIEQALGA